MAFLNSVSQHGAVDFSENILPDLNDQVRPDSEDMGVKGGMMNLAQRQSIHHGSDTAFMAICHDVGGVQ
jgi:hypothetical protein